MPNHGIVRFNFGRDANHSKKSIRVVVYKPHTMSKKNPQLETDNTGQNHVLTLPPPNLPPPSNDGDSPDDNGDEQANDSPHHTSPNCYNPLGNFQSTVHFEEMETPRATAGLISTRLQKTL